MSKRYHHQFSWSFLVVMGLCAAFSGCKSSSFSMPGKNMFTWKREPDAATLAGNTKVPSNLPESPAAKYNPAALASTGGSPASGSTAATSNPYAYGATGSSTTGQPGLAAAANGYLTGPYPVAPKTTAPPTTAVASTATSGALPSPYGGSYGGSSAVLTSGVQGPGNMAPAQTTGATTLGGTTAGSTGGYGLPSLPNAGGLASAASAAATNALPVGFANNSSTTPAATSAYQMMPTPPAYPSSNPYASTAGSAGFPLPGAGVNLPALPNTTVGSMSANNSLLPSTPSSQVNSSVTPAGAAAASTPGMPSSAYQGSGSGGSYSPGSTGRSTNYDFSKGGSSGSTSSATPSGTLSTSAPVGNGSLPLLR